MNSASSRRAPRALPVLSAGVALALLGGGASAAVMSNGTRPDDAASGAAASGDAMSDDMVALMADPAPGDVAPGVPPGVALDTSGHATGGAAWTAQEGLVYVITMGSSNCPVIADLEAQNTKAGVGLAHADEVADIDVTVQDLDPSQVCTTDYGPTTTVVASPDGKDHGSPVSVQIEGIGRGDLLPREQAGQVGLPTWITPDH